MSSKLRQSQMMIIVNSLMRDTLNMSIGTLGYLPLKHVIERDRVCYGKRKSDQVYTVVRDFAQF